MNSDTESAPIDLDRLMQDQDTYAYYIASSVAGGREPKTRDIAAFVAARDAVTAEVERRRAERTA